MQAWLNQLQPKPAIGEKGIPFPFEKRLVIALIISAISGLLCWQVLTKFSLAGGDFTWAMQAAQDLVAGRDPYNHPVHQYAIPYPLTAALVGLPFLFFTPELGAALFFGLSSGLLAFGITKYGLNRLWIFLSYPYFAALVTAQWSPLLMAGSLLTVLFPAMLAKPHLGLPLALTYLTWRRFWLAVAFGVLSLIISPTWPLKWLTQLGEFQNFIPVLLLPGPLLLLALVDYRNRDARLLLIAALLPQRWFYDNFILWLIPKSRLELLATAVISWAIGYWRWTIGIPDSIADVGRMSVYFVYLPMLVIILLRWRKQIKHT